MPTRLNAILLIPVLVGLVMGGFQVKGAIDTWDEARDAEATARLVRASLDYGNRLIEERDVSAAPLLKGKKNSPAVVKARKATDAAATAFNDAAKDMPHKPVLFEAVGTQIVERTDWDQTTMTHEPQVLGQAAHLWTRTSLRPKDVDVYSFTGTAGTVTLGAHQLNICSRHRACDSVSFPSLICSSTEIRCRGSCQCSTMPAKVSTIAIASAAPMK